MHAIGIYLDDDEWKTAQVTYDKKKFQIQLDKDVKSFYNSVLVSGLDAWEVFLRPLHLELTSMRQINAVLPFQAESLFSHPLEELVLFPILKKREKRGSQLSIFATKKDFLLQHLERLKSHELDPAVVSCTSAALFRYARHYFPEEPSLFVYHLGKKRSQCIAIEEGDLCYAHAHSIGSSHLLEAAVQSQKEIDRLLSFLSKKCPSVSKVVLTGEGEHWRTLFSKALPSPLTLLDSSEAAPYAIPIGLALDHLSQDRFSMQWRSGAFTSPSVAKKRVKFSLGYLASCVALTLLVWIAGFSLVKHKEEKLKASIGFEGKNLYQKVEEWESSLSKKKISFPFAVTAPKVSEVLTWLSTHPKLTQFEIKNFRYNLVKCAKIEAKNEGYEAKIDLEFTTNSPRLAREFHDALLSGDRLVNAKKEIKWQAQQNSYFTSFFVK